MRHVDQRGLSNPPAAFDNPAEAAPDGWLTAEAAAALLEVKRPTLYSYASRGLVRTSLGPDTRSRRYARADLLQLKARHDARSGHGPVAAGALRFGEPVLESGITEITPEGPRYRGHAALDLVARHAPFEQVAELLWTGELPAQARWPAPDGGPLLTLEVPRETPLPTVLSWATWALAASDPARFGAPLRAEWARSRALCRQLAAALALGQPRARERVRRSLRAGSVAEAAALALGLPSGPKARALVDQVLVMCADHELNVSTFAARVAASSGADLYACVGAALATHSGPLHGGACDRIEALLDEAGGVGGHPRRSAARVVSERLQRGEALPGFEHKLYPQGDPRTPPLLRAALAHAPRQARLRRLIELVEVAEATRQLRPSVDLGVVAVASALQGPPGASVGLFALGRLAGWLAHALEQRQAGFLLRPRARYVGPVTSATAGPKDAGPTDAVRTDVRTDAARR
jgi:citrate synthase